MVLWNVLAAHYQMRSWLSVQLAASRRRSAALEQVCCGISNCSAWGQEASVCIIGFHVIR